MRSWVARLRMWMILSALIGSTCLFAVSPAGQIPPALYNEDHRPQYHFTPAINWTNDPNGAVFYQGEYHIFYQSNPFGDEWGHMTWGHAVSPDMVHWQLLPPAIAEEGGIMIFSGSVVVDWKNSSGFCTQHPAAAKKSSTQYPEDDTSCLIAIYTGHTEVRQTQNLAYSNDRGRTWTKYLGNPVIDLHLKDFRDPKVFWHQASGQWIMVTALPQEHKVRFFGSKNLKQWETLGDFGPAGAVGGLWECPDLFELSIQGESGHTRWVLSVNLNPGGPAGGSGNQYFVGDFDGKRFIQDDYPDSPLWADHGRDFYASTSFSDLPSQDGRRIWLAWMSNWDYARQIPTSPWRGGMTIPRTLSLTRYPEGLRLTQAPIAELAALRAQSVTLQGLTVRQANQALQKAHVGGDSLEMLAEIDLGSAGSAGINVFVGKSKGEATAIGVDRINSELFVDRTHSGPASIDAKFPGRHAGGFHTGRSGRVRLHIFVDRGSVEVFGGDGETVLTDLVFPSPGSQGVEVFAKGGEAKIVKLQIWKLHSAWRY